MPKKGQLKKSAKARSVKQRKYNSSPTQKKRRAERNAARRKMVAAGRAKKGDGKDVHHKDHNTSNNRTKNLSVISRSKNRSMNKKR